MISMIMTNIAALAVQNTSSEVAIRLPSVESIAIHRVFDQLRNGPARNRVGKSWWIRGTGDQAIQFNAENRGADGFAGDDIGSPSAACRCRSRGVDRLTFYRRLDPNGFGHSPSRSSTETVAANRAGQKFRYHNISLDHTAALLTPVANEVSIIETPSVSSQVRPAAADVQRPSGDLADPPRWCSSSSMPNISVRFASTDVEYVPERVSIESSEFENGRTKTHLQTAARVCCRSL